jgi:REP element-mobilizing transposase RayT
MTRPLRVEFPGALYHVTARGNSRHEIYLQDADRRIFLSILGSVVEKRSWI